MNRLTIIATCAAIISFTPLFAAASNVSTGASVLSSVNVLLGVLALIQTVGILSLSGTLKNIARKSDVLIEMKKQIASKNSGSPDILKSTLLLIFFSGFVGLLQAQDTLAVANSQPLDSNAIALIILNVILFLVFLYVVRLVYQAVSLLTPANPEKVKTEVEVQEKQSVLSKVFVDAVPLEEEDSIMLDHEYDGIHELDNNLPPWWVWMFYATIIFAFVYLAYYWILPYGQSQKEEYVAELKQAEMDKEAYLATVKDKVDENTVSYLDNPADLVAGKKIFTANCQACHAPDGGGGVGPNLTDKYWLHGGGIPNIFKTIKYGVPAKGMISWEAQLKPKQIAQVASYIHSLSGTMPAAPKDPQGVVWNPVNTDQIAPDSLKATDRILPTDSILPNK